MDIILHSNNAHGHYSIDFEKAFKIIPQASQSEVGKVSTQHFLEKKYLVRAIDFFPYWFMGINQRAMCYALVLDDIKKGIEEFIKLFEGNMPRVS